jgi:hypothetical protein
LLRLNLTIVGVNIKRVLDTGIICESVLIFEFCEAENIRNLIRIIPGLSETIYDPHLEQILGTSIGYHFEWAGCSLYIGQQIFVHKRTPNRQFSVQNNNILEIVLKRALGIRHSMAMVCLLLESTPCFLFIVILFF